MVVVVVVGGGGGGVVVWGVRVRVLCVLCVWKDVTSVTTCALGPWNGVAGGASHSPCSSSRKFCPVVVEEAPKYIMMSALAVGARSGLTKAGHWGGGGQGLGALVENRTLGWWWKGAEPWSSSTLTTLTFFSPIFICALIFCILFCGMVGVAASCAGSGVLARLRGDGRSGKLS